MASFVKRGDTWQYTVSRYIDGKSKPIRKGGFRTKKEAQTAAAIVEAELHKNPEVQTKERSFADYYFEWINVHKKNRDDKTFKRYLHTHKLVEDYFANKSLGQIKRIDYQAFISHIGNGRAYETVRKINTQIRACVQDAVEEGFIRIDFTRKVDLYHTAEEKSEDLKYLNEDEANKIYDYLIYNLNDDFISRYAMLLALVTGMRFGELCGLTDEDFSFEDNSILISKTWAYDVKDGGFGPLKANAKPRRIKVDERVMKLYEGWLKRRSGRPQSLVFHSDKSQSFTITNNAANKSLGLITHKLGITDITFHGFRHTHASMMLYKGASIQSVAERLGHSNVATTLETYTHVLNELRERDESIATSMFGANV